MTLPEVPTPDMPQGFADAVIQTLASQPDRLAEVDRAYAITSGQDFGRKPITLRSNSLDNKGK